MPYREPAMLQHCRVLRESPHGSRKYPKCYSSSFTNRLFFVVCCYHSTVLSMDRCDEDVIIAFGFYLLSEEKKRTKKGKYWIHKVFRAR